MEPVRSSGRADGTSCMTTSGAVPRTAGLRLAACVRSAKRSVPCRVEGETLGSLATKRPRSEHREWYGVPGLRMVAVCPRGCSRLRLTAGSYASAIG